MKAVGLLTDISSKELTEKAALPNRGPLLPGDGAFDGVCALVRRFFNCRAAVVNIVDRDGVLFRAPSQEKNGASSVSVALDLARWADGASLPADVRFLANPLLAGEHGLRFYAGVPLVTAGGHDMGVLAALDTAHRPFSEDDIESLKLFAGAVVENLDLRITAALALSQ